MDFLSNPIWQFIANIAVALLGIFITSIISVAIYRKQQNRKGITYKIISDTPILRSKKEIKGTIQLLFKEKPVNNARIVILRIWNSENTPILPTDFIDPIKLNFGIDSEILDAEILETTPNYLKDKAEASLKIKNDSLILEPILLNSKNSITLKVLIAQNPLTRIFVIDAHIVGIDGFQNFYRIPATIVPLARLFTFFSFFVFLLLVTYILLARNINDNNLRLLDITLIISGAFFYIGAFIIFGALFYSVVYKTSYIYAVKYLIIKLVKLIESMIYTDNPREE